MAVVSRIPKPSLPDFRYETAALARGLLRVAGVDEVGRGPLCGPVTAAAVRLDPARIPPGLNDSKKLGRQAREDVLAVLLTCAEVSVAHASVEEIDRLNILRASHLAMCRAVAGLAPVDHLLIDGNMVPREMTARAEAIVGGDALSLSIAAASIAAKVARDRLMASLALAHPGYGWENNAGYSTAEHLAALKMLGVTPHHRRSFRPVREALAITNPTGT